MARKRIPAEEKLPEEEYWYLRPVKTGRKSGSRSGDEAGAESGTDAADGAGRMREERPEIPEEKENRLNEGHRGRLRERFRKEGGFDSFQDHEILELLLTYGSPRKDTKDLAKQLLRLFGSLKGVFETPAQQLMKVDGLGEVQATLLGMMMPMARKLRQCEMESPRQIANRRELEHYCTGMLMGKRIEEFWVICVNAQCRVLGQQMISTGSLSEVSAYPRLVMEAVLNFNAHSVFFCHNHPGGTCGPSPEDIATTLQLQRMLSSVDVLVLDHLIVAGSNTYSMAQHGDLEFGARGKSR